MTVRFQAWITRYQMRANPETLYVFGDNLAGTGYGGQAKEMRGEPNAVGVPTKRGPGTTPRDYFTDDELEEVWPQLHRIFTMLSERQKAGIEIVIPANWFAPDCRSQLPDRAPDMYAGIRDMIAILTSGKVPPSWP